MFEKGQLIVCIHSGPWWRVTTRRKATGPAYGERCVADGYYALTVYGDFIYLAPPWHEDGGRLRPSFAEKAFVPIEDFERRQDTEETEETKEPGALPVPLLEVEA